jgi:hypothetical protein
MRKPFCNSQNKTVSHFQIPQTSGDGRRFNAIGKADFIPYNDCKILPRG